METVWCGRQHFGDISIPAIRYPSLSKRKKPLEEAMPSFLVLKFSNFTNYFPKYTTYYLHIYI